ncbi:transposase [Chryseobacterium sp. OSA05B]|uniref:transposase n=1 Tax=Chryseobacterium sp. OSA05B TaxID=2862650 RepID=UPI001CBC406A|nr:transposase [Chryseobacterium sp. OSA05B]
MLQRIKKFFGIENNNDLDNEVEADENYIDGKNKKHHTNQKIEGSQGRIANDKVPVVGMIERDGKLNAYKVQDVKSHTLTREIIKNVKESAKLYTNEYVNGNVHTSTIEGFLVFIKKRHCRINLQNNY